MILLSDGALAPKKAPRKRGLFYCIEPPEKQQNSVSDGANAPRSKIFDTVIQDVKSLSYDFRINDLDETIEVKINEQDWERLNSTHDDIITLEMQEIGYGSWKNIALSTMNRAVTKYANSKRYNPIRDYLDNIDLSKYEAISPNGSGVSQPHVISDFSEKYVTNQDGMFGLWLFKWMVGAIAKVYQGERNAMLVLGGPQQIGKSRLSQWLNPVDKGFVRGPVQPDSKDHRIRLNMKFIWEVDELDSTTRRQDASSLKSFMTLDETFERHAFKKHPLTKPTVTSFIGTINPDGAGFLNDTTGSTRFLVCEIQGLNWQGYTKEVDVHDLWREAMYFYTHIPRSWELTAQQEQKRREINSRFELISSLQDTIEAQFEITFDKSDFLTTQQIKDGISSFYRITNEQAFYNELQRTSQKLGLEKGRSAKAEGYKRGWVGIRIKPKK